MKIYDDNLDLYGPDGKIIEESVPLESISPLKNSAIQQMIYDIKTEKRFIDKKYEHMNGFQLSDNHLNKIIIK